MNQLNGIEEIDRSDGTRRPDGAHRYLAVAGNIGAGKTSLVELLGRREGLTPFFEPNEDNPYLEDFYQDMQRWSFASQVYFLAAKYRVHLELEAAPRDVIQDRTIWEDAEIFAANLHGQGLMRERDYRTYRQLYEAIRERLRPPDLMIYLRCLVRTLRRRIAQRGRPMEQEIPDDYLARLNELYERWIGDYRISPLLVIPTDKLDYISDLVDRQDIFNAIARHLQQPEQQ